ncbi:tumor necrosis factor receptor superfamily member 1A isoform X2 [Betta splendens]|uniref:Tumor necrosis factor receptor superfamily member 1A isoform X2 n=1 Tax=Betta splendens TaxID=158456 RepID=A0A6P7KW99_BETSP|nr:tumor necrosis factor receptor superfamily member 1A isoform X2 [Betta splendens]
MWNMNCGHRGSWSLTLLLLCTLTPLVTSQTCPPGDYVSETGICCNKCSPGFKLVRECNATGHRSSCVVCPKEQYTDQMNYVKNCRSCIRCKDSDNKEQESPCEKHRNRVCRCKEGFYKSMIDSETFDCLKCKICGSEETVKQTCSPEKNTQCACKENYYRHNKKCEPCKACSPECRHLCPEPTKPATLTTTKEGTGPELLKIMAVCAAPVLVLLILVTVVTYVATKRSTKKKLRRPSSDPRSISQDSCKVLIVDEEPCSEHSVQAVALVPESEQESCKLPDCVPLEVNIPDLIYAVLDLVPVQQVKQLVRTLGVRDTEIEQAEMDHRGCREAHYQMLRAWAERGPPGGRGGRGRVVCRPQLEGLLEQLRRIHLGRAAEELGTKYGLA